MSRKECDARYRVKRITFKGKRVSLKSAPRRNRCERCGKNKGDSFIDYDGIIRKIRRTSMHHWFYLIIMPWACTEELCNSCHTKERWMPRGLIS